MSKEELLTFKGTVVELLPNADFRVKLDDQNHIIIARIAGNMRKHKIRILTGDKVDVEMSHHDFNRGRITQHHR